MFFVFLINFILEMLQFPNGCIRQNGFLKVLLGWYAVCTRMVDRVGIGMMFSICVYVFILANLVFSSLVLVLLI